MDAPLGVEVSEMVSRDLLRLFTRFLAAGISLAEVLHGRRHILAAGEHAGKSLQEIQVVDFDFYEISHKSPLKRYYAIF